MALFEISDIDKKLSEKATKLEASASDNSFELSYQIRCKASELLTKLIGRNLSNRFVEFCTAGEFSMHELLTYLLEQSGPADVYISTWTLKEEPARILYALKQSGAIRNLYFVFDYRIRTLDAKHFDFIEKFATGYVLTKCHAKVMVIDGERLKASVVSSANMSNNPRIECGYIMGNEHSMNFHKQWIMDVINGKKVY